MSVHTASFSLLDQIRVMLPGEEVMLLGFTDRWAVASQLQSCGTIEIDEYYGFGEDPLTAILNAYENVVLGSCKPCEWKRDT